jgi:hypothetical protein
VPRSALVVLILVAGILLLMGIVSDMGRSAINVCNGIGLWKTSADRRGSAWERKRKPSPFQGKKTPDRHVRGNVTKFIFFTANVSVYLALLTLCLAALALFPGYFRIYDNIREYLF